MITTFYRMNSVLFAGSYFNALDCFNVMSWHAVICSSNKRERTSIDGVLRIFHLVLGCNLLIGNILSFKDAG